jgi:hypothetical protein
MDATMSGWIDLNQLLHDLLVSFCAIYVWTAVTRD